MEKTCFHKMLSIQISNGSELWKWEGKLGMGEKSVGTGRNERQEEEVLEQEQAS